MISVWNPSGAARPLYRDGDHGFAREWDVGLVQFHAQECPIGTFQQSGTDGAVNLDGKPDQAVLECFNSIGRDLFGIPALCFEKVEER